MSNENTPRTQNTRQAENGVYGRYLVLVGLIGVTASVALWVRLRGMEQRVMASRFHDHALERATAIQRELQQCMRPVNYMAGFFAGSQCVEKEEFAEFAAPILSHSPWIRSMHWIPRVPAGERSRFEAALREDGTASAEIQEGDGTGGRIRAPERDEYYPLSYSAGSPDHEALRGLDAASAPELRQVLQTCADKNELIISTEVRPFAETGEGFTFLAAVPVYGKRAPAAAVAQRRAALEGFVLALFDGRAVVGEALEWMHRQQLDISIMDDSAPAGRQVLFRRAPARQGDAENAFGASTAGFDLSFSRDLAAGDRKWQFVCLPSDAYIARHRGREPAGGALSGLIITGMLVVYLMVTGRSARIERLVSQRTGELRDANAKLQTEEERFRQLAENVCEVFYIASADGDRIEYVNPAYEQVWNHSIQALYECPGLRLDAVVPEDQARARTALRTAAVNGAFDEEYRIVRGDGKVRWIRDRGFPVKDENGMVHRIVGIAEDVTDRREFEERLRATAQDLAKKNLELAHKNTEMEQFIYTVSHDLKSPLVTILGFSTYLSEDLPGLPSDQVLDYLGRIQQGANRMAEFIDDLLDLSRIGRVARTPEPVRLGDLIAEVAAHHEHELVSRNIRLVIHEREDMPCMMVDSGRMVQVFDNLLTNAIKYGCDSTAPVIEIASLETDGEIRIFLRDNGQGIPSEHHARIFELFQRLQVDKNGTGAGLAIVKRIMEAHGGRVWVESEPGQGAAFWLAFPSTSLVRDPTTGHEDARESEAALSAV